VKARAQDRHGNWFEVEGREIMALALVHEIGHLNGELFVDFVIGDLWEGERPH
jgi:peptide deformylase